MGEIIESGILGMRSPKNSGVSVALSRPSAKRLTSSSSISDAGSPTRMGSDGLGWARMGSGTLFKTPNKYQSLLPSVQPVKLTSLL
jgi:hypothetical protein